MTGVLVGAVAAAIGAAEGVVLVWLDIAFLRSVRRRRREQAVEALSTQIRSILVDFLAGADKVAEVRALLQQDVAAVTEGILSFRGAVAGGARERLSELALTLGLVRDWCADTHLASVVARREAFSRLAFVSAYEPCRRICGEVQVAALEDPDQDVRISAARGLIQSGEPETLERVFDFALESDLLTRAVLAEDLRRYAAELSQQAIPFALSTRDSRRTVAALQIVASWQRAVVLPDLPRLVADDDRGVRLHALRLAPMIPLMPEARSAILSALADPDPEIQTAAALSAGRLRMAESLPLLQALVRDAGAEVARNAATAMAAMPPEGPKALAELSSAANSLTAEIAKAALGGGNGVRP